MPEDGILLSGELQAAAAQVAAFYFLLLLSAWAATFLCGIAIVKMLNQRFHFGG